MLIVWPVYYTEVKFSFCSAIDLWEETTIKSSAKTERNSKCMMLSDL